MIIDRSAPRADAQEVFRRVVGGRLARAVNEG